MTIIEFTVHFSRHHQWEIQTLYRIRDSVQTATKPVCPLDDCTKSFLKREHLRQHLLEQHTVNDRLNSYLALRGAAFDHSTACDICPICGKGLSGGETIIDHLSNNHVKVDEQHLEAWTQSVLHVHPHVKENVPLVTRRLLSVWVIFTTHKDIWCGYCEKEIPGWRGCRIHHFKMLYGLDAIRKHRDLLYKMMQGLDRDSFESGPAWDDLDPSAQTDVVPTPMFENGARDTVA